MTFCRELGRVSFPFPPTLRLSHKTSTTLRGRDFWIETLTNPGRSSNGACTVGSWRLSIPSCQDLQKFVSPHCRGATADLSVNYFFFAQTSKRRHVPFNLQQEMLGRGLKCQKRITFHYFLAPALPLGR